ncbi:MAG: SRPBCC family protein [Nocardiaceae bacterium]|nr:SRPBCC family protein [Nocardiaceae bacterium]
MSDEQKVVSASRTIAAPTKVIFDLIAEPSNQPSWDGNDNLVEAPIGQRITGVEQSFVMLTTKGNTRVNHVVEFDEGRLIAWMPAEVTGPPFGHLWRWELTEIDDDHTRVTHTYDWSQLTDENRFERARWTTSERLMESVNRLAERAEGS